MKIQPVVPEVPDLCRQISTNWKEHLFQMKLRKRPTHGMVPFELSNQKWVTVFLKLTSVKHSSARRHVLQSEPAIHAVHGWQLRRYKSQNLGRSCSILSNPLAWQGRRALVKLVKLCFLVNSTDVGVGSGLRPKNFKSSCVEGKALLQQVERTHGGGVQLHRVFVFKKIFIHEHYNNILGHPCVTRTCLQTKKHKHTRGDPFLARNVTEHDEGIWHNFFCASTWNKRRNKRWHDKNHQQTCQMPSTFLARKGSPFVK